MNHYRLQQGAHMPSIDQVKDEARSRLRWLAVHGVVRAFAKRGAKMGDPQAMLISDPATREDPSAVYKQIGRAHV